MPLRSQHALLVAIVLFAIGAHAQVSLVPSADTAEKSAARSAVAQPDSFLVSRYVIQGVVADDQGSPVEGVALHIGRRVAYTDSSGRFLLRLSKRASFPFSIAPEEFVTNGVYQVLCAPSEVHSESEDGATDVQVVVRRVPTPQAKLYRQ